MVIGWELHCSSSPTIQPRWAPAVPAWTLLSDVLLGAIFWLPEAAVTVEHVSIPPSFPYLCLLLLFLSQGSRPPLSGTEQRAAAAAATIIALIARFFCRGAEISSGASMLPLQSIWKKKNQSWESIYTFMYFFNIIIFIYFLFNRRENKDCGILEEGVEKGWGWL